MDGMRVRAGICSRHYLEGAPGTVQDSTGAVVPNATVKLINEGTRATLATQTSAAGTYVFEAVQSGSYELDAESVGFARSRRAATRSPSVSPPR